MPDSPLIKTSAIITDPHEQQEFAVAVTDAALLYNHCKRCGRRIKAPQEYGRVCARKIRQAAPAPQPEDVRVGKEGQTDAAAG